MLPTELAEGYRRAGYWRGETLVDRFDATCAEHAARTALLDGEAQLRFEQVAECVERVAQWFATMTDPGDIVAWQLPNWHEAVVLYRACWRLGAVACPLHGWVIGLDSGQAEAPDEGCTLTVAARLAGDRILLSLPAINASDELRWEAA